MKFGAFALATVVASTVHLTLAHAVEVEGSRDAGSVAPRHVSVFDAESSQGEPWSQRELASAAQGSSFLAMSAGAPARDGMMLGALAGVVLLAVRRLLQASC